MKKKLAIINTDPKEFSYGGVAPIMRNMHTFLSKEFDIQYFYLSEKWKNFPGLNRFKTIIYLFLHKNELKKNDFILSHIPEGSYVTACLNIPYAHIYHGNDNPMSQSKYWFGRYFAWVFNIFYKKIEKTAAIKYTVGPVWDDKKKLFNPIQHDVSPKPINERAGFIFAGRLELIKNVDRLISIYSQLSPSIQDKNHFYIAGYGTQETNLKKLVAKLNLTDKIHFLGNLPNHKLIEEVSAKKILIMASTQEGLPTAIAEALSVAVPVITTNPGDIGIVIKSQYNGFIFPLDFKDEAYLDAIKKVLSTYEQFAQHAKESASIFDGEQITKSVINDISEILIKKETK
jgi:glycosyltransferase involved in cell wall biosynthesis